MSRFLSFAVSVSSTEEATRKIKECQNKYHDARHVCWAYMLGAKRETWQLNDNGEPSGTAGKPILGQINSKGLTDVLVMVVRYFGGIKLGTSGLIAAYREAARLALEDAGTKECHEMGKLSFQFSYADMDGIMRVVKAEETEITEKNFDNLCSMKIIIKEADRERIKGLIESRGGTIL